MAANNCINKASESEYKCIICLQILIEPVVLPCKHEMCKLCFRKNVEEGNFLCPMCRKRIASWARKCIREGTLVDQNRWNLIQKLFPDKCLKRLQGDDDESEDESYQPPPKRVLAQTGELRQEYEQEMNKILQVQEEEEQASKDLIQTILEEERALQLQQENQEKDDEQLARKLSEKLKQTKENEEGTSKTVTNGLKTPNDSSRTKSTHLKTKKRNNKNPGRSSTLDRYFFSKEKHSENASRGKPNVSDEHHHYKSDYELAMALQKQFDQEEVAGEERDDYMLRQATSSDNRNRHAFTQEKQQSTCKLNEEKNEHTDIRGKYVRVADKLLQVDGENTQSDKNKAKIQIQSKEMQNLRDRSILIDSMKLDVHNDNNHEL